MSKLGTSAGVVLIAMASQLVYARDSPKDEPPKETVQQILETPLPEEAYAAPERCLMLHEYDNVRVLTEELVVFVGRRGRYWLNQLHNRCVGLRPDLTLKMTLHNAQVCDLDTFRGLDTTGLSPLMGSGNCMFGRFEPISKEQLNLLESALRMRRSSPAVDRTERAEKAVEQGASSG